MSAQRRNTDRKDWYQLQCGGAQKTSSPRTTLLPNTKILLGNFVDCVKYLIILTSNLSKKGTLNLLINIRKWRQRGKGKFFFDTWYGRNMSVNFFFCNTWNDFWEILFTCLFANFLPNCELFEFCFQNFT